MATLINKLCIACSKIFGYGTDDPVTSSQNRDSASGLELAGTEEQSTEDSDRRRAPGNYPPLQTVHPYNNILSCWRTNYISTYSSLRGHSKFPRDEPCRLWALCPEKAKALFCRM